MFALRGDFQRAYQEAHRALEIDPYAIIINSQLGENYRRGGEFQKAIDQSQKTIEFDSTSAQSHYAIGFVYIALKQSDSAVFYLRKADLLAPTDTRYLSALGFAEGMAGNNNEAQRIQKVLLDHADQKYVPAYDLAVAALGAGKKDRALKYLEQAYEERGPWMPFLIYNPIFDTLRSESDFKTLLDKIIIHL
jgi:tetratricopeptide (TPR) repeat protein